MTQGIYRKENTMKTKILALILASLMIIMTLASCENKDNKENGDNYTLKIGTIKGPTGMGMAKVITDDKDVGKYDFEVFNEATDISAKLLGKQLDIAAVPVNLAAVINKKTEGAYLVAAINTLGVLYIMENGNTIESVSDLAGKTIHAYGQGATPEYILNFILEKNNIKDQVTVQWYPDPAALSAQSAQGNVDVIMLPEPQVTAAIISGTANGNTAIRTALNLTEEWDKVSDEKLVQGCIVVKKEIVEAYPALVSAFLDDYKASINYVNSNIDEASAMIAEIGIVPKAPIAKQAIPRCNIVFIEGDAMISAMNAMFGVLFSANPQSIGGTLPSESIYYKR